MRNTRDQCHLILDIENLSELEVGVVVRLNVIRSHILILSCVCEAWRCGQVFVQLSKTIRGQCSR